MSEIPIGNPRRRKKGATKTTAQKASKAREAPASEAPPPTPDPEVAEPQEDPQANVEALEPMTAAPDGAPSKAEISDPAAAAVLAERQAELAKKTPTTTDELEDWLVHFTWIADQGGPKGTNRLDFAKPRLRALGLGVDQRERLALAVDDPVPVYLPQEEPEIVNLSSGTESMAVNLEDSELLAAGSRLVEIREEKSTLEGDLAQVKQQFKADETRLEAEASKLATMIRRRTEIRLVHTKTVADFEAGAAITLRQDNGEELRRRALSESEKQRSLPGLEVDPEGEPLEDDDLDDVDDQDGPERDEADQEATE